METNLTYIRMKEAADQCDPLDSLEDYELYFGTKIEFTFFTKNGYAKTARWEFSDFLLEHSAKRPSQEEIQEKIMSAYNDILFERTLLR